MAEINETQISILSWDQLPALLSVSEAAKIARVGKAQIYNLSHTKNFPAVRFGRIIRIPKEAFKRWIETESAKLII